MDMVPTYSNSCYRVCAVQLNQSGVEMGELKLCLFINYCLFDFLVKKTKHGTHCHVFLFNLYRYKKTQMKLWISRHNFNWVKNIM